MKRMCVVLIVVLGCVIPVGVSSQSSASYRIIGGDLNAGGSVAMASGSYRSSGTIGQSSPIGVAGSASYQAQVGVQYLYHGRTDDVAPHSYILWTQ